MKKAEFMASLSCELKGLSKEEKNKILDYYDEIIDDRIEGGEDEETAVSSVGTTEEIVSKFLGENPPHRTKITKSNVAITVGAPLWAPLLIALLVIVFSFYIVVWSVVGSVAITVAALVIAAPVGAILAVISIFMGNTAAGFWSMGSCLAVFGIAMLVLLPTIRLVKCSAYITKESVSRMIRLAKGGRKI